MYLLACSPEVIVAGRQSTCFDNCLAFVSVVS
jgi:hypothetical protein